MPTIKEYSQEGTNKTPPAAPKQSIWTRPIYIHVMPQLRRKVSHRTFFLTIAVWALVLFVLAIYFFIK
ncbi:MAG: hypothetical protein ACOYMB_03090 [Patescibacteria group bacterium]